MRTNGSQHEVIELIKMTLGSAAALGFVWGLLNFATILGPLGLTTEELSQQQSASVLERVHVPVALKVLDRELYEPPFDADLQPAGASGRGK